MDLKGQKVLVTGADGFIGSHLVQALVRQNADVRALVFYNSFNHLGWLEEILEKDHVEIIAGDVRDEQICKRIMKGIDAVFHLAALIAIPYSYIAASSYLQTNVLGTQNICQAAMESNVKRVIHTSTSEVYGTARYVPIDESHPLQPQSPYSASKIGADSIALSYFYAFNLPVTIVRPFNAYGPRQSARAIIPSLIQEIMAKKTEVLMGNSTPTRDFTFVEDLCQCFIRVFLSDQTIGEIINVGTGKEIQMGALAYKIADLMGQKICLNLDPRRLRPEKSEVYQLCCNPEKLLRLTSFVPRVSLDEGLKQTIEWFETNKDRYKTSYHV